ncbi:GNAT family N-acetyltransferase [Pontibacter oryzae]|uniref:GNAT family N-acetyltransferase n=1 Tax=Pontibacter oryzae TaxID=2304593 RepID=A0A399S488_9BACT|nr:GNAT family N-acetyltransferase [Pontibacter oryzae]RIJ36892.1 GNAT family N-acetyltransferase [Pontibacter oryzae]
MPTFHFSFLTAKEFPQLHEAFLKAFADYVIPIQLTKEQFRAKVIREGIEPSFCVAAYDGQEIAGFILTGLGEWQGKPTAYNAGTGVLPQYRGQKLTQQMYDVLLPKLRASGIEQCLLEVIQDNNAALRSYQAVGLHITRSLDCFRALKTELLLPAHNDSDFIEVLPTEKADLKLFRCFRDVTPTWQNSFAAIKRSREQCCILEARNVSKEVVGYIAFFPKSGAIAQLAVDELWRKKGVGTALLREATRQVEAPAIMFINIESTAQSMISFLTRRHMQLILKQYEMLMAIA